MNELITYIISVSNHKLPKTFSSLLHEKHIPHLHTSQDEQTNGRSWFKQVLPLANGLQLSQARKKWHNYWDAHLLSPCSSIPTNNLKLWWHWALSVALFGPIAIVTKFNIGSIKKSIFSFFYEPSYDSLSRWRMALM